MIRALLASVRPVRDDRGQSTEGNRMDALAARVDHLARQYGHRATVHEGRVVVVPLDVHGKPVTDGCVFGCPPRSVVVETSGDQLDMWVDVHWGQGDACEATSTRERSMRAATPERQTRIVLRYVESELRRRS